MDCLRCRNRMVIDPSYFDWIIENLITFNRDGMDDENKEKLDLLLNLLEGLPYGRI